MTKKIQQQLKKYQDMEIFDLMKLASEKKRTLIELKRQLLFGKLTNHEELRKIKKEVARILTLVSEKAELEIKGRLKKSLNE